MTLESVQKGLDNWAKFLYSFIIACCPSVPDQKFLWHYEIKFLDPSPGAKLCLFHFFTSAFERAFYLVIIPRYPCNFLYFVSSWLNRTTVKYNLNCIAQQLLWTWLIVVVADMRTKESNLLQQKVFKKIQIDTGTLKCVIIE